MPTWPGGCRTPPSISGEHVVCRCMLCVPGLKKKRVFPARRAASRIPSRGPSKGFLEFCFTWTLQPLSRVHECAASGASIIPTNALFLIALGPSSSGSFVARAPTSVPGQKASRPWISNPPCGQPLPSPNYHFFFPGCLSSL